MHIATLRYVGVPEAEVRMAECTYEETKCRVVWGSGISEEFRVDVGLGSAQSPLLFIAVVEVISRKVHTSEKTANGTKSRQGHRKPPVVLSVPDSFYGTRPALFSTLFV